MGTEYGSRRVVRIQLRPVSCRLDDSLRIVAWLVPFQSAGHPSKPFRIGNDFHLVSLKLRYGNAAAQDGVVHLLLRRRKGAAHLLDVRHSSPDGFLRDFQNKVVDRFQQDTFRLHQSLPDSAVRRLPEVSAFCMFLVGSSGCQGDFQIGDFRSGQNSWMLPLCQMGQDQTLPVLIQHIVAALIVENESAAPLTRFQNQMDFRIVAEGLKVAHPSTFFVMVSLYTMLPEPNSARTPNRSSIMLFRISI